MTAVAQPVFESLRLLPRVAATRDRVLPTIAAGSLLLHATLLLPLMLREDAVPTPPREITIELVRSAPKPAERAAAKPVPQARKPSPRRQLARKPLAKPRESVGQRLKDLLGPMPAIVLPGAAEAGTEAVSYSQLVLSKVAKAKKVGRYRGIPGAAAVAFALSDSGEIARVAIERPSGDPSLDDEAIAMVRRGAPYPPPPPGGRRDYVITLRFSALP